jgi:hypothetical protein
LGNEKILIVALSLRLQRRGGPPRHLRRIDVPLAAVPNENWLCFVTFLLVSFYLPKAKLALFCHFPFSFSPPLQPAQTGMQALLISVKPPQTGHELIDGHVAL